MPAIIQITQPETGIEGEPGRSLLGLDSTYEVVLTDAGGPGATSYLWEIISWPSPRGEAPDVLSPTEQTTNVKKPNVDGIYIVKLTRTDGTTVTTDIKFFGCADADGLHLPSAGQNRAMSNMTPTSQTFGWAGGMAGDSNVLLDAFLRLRRLREGRYVGRWAMREVDGTTEGEVLFRYGQDDPTQVVYVVVPEAPPEPALGPLRRPVEGVTLNFPTEGAEDGATFRLLLSIAPGANPVVLRSDESFIGVMPQTLTERDLVYWLDVYYVGFFGMWVAFPPKLVEPLISQYSKEYVVLSGSQKVFGDTWAQVGAFTLSPEERGSVILRAVLQTSDPDYPAEIRLRWRGEETVVVDSTLSTSETLPTDVAASLTMGSTPEEIATFSQTYIIECRASGGEVMATCSEVALRIDWVQGLL